MIPSLCIISIQILNAARLIYGYNQDPKLYIDVESVESIDPLLHGFNIHMKQEFIDVHLNPFLSPVIYVSAIPLDPDARAVRRIFYIEEINAHIVTVRELDSQTWYVICLEFENMHKRQRHGNTSTSCALKRTLDHYGMGSDSVITNVVLGRINPTSMQIILQANIDAPMFLEISLQQGSCALQRYFISQPKSLDVLLPDLEPGFNYGQVCVREIPILDAYTAMGRTAHAEGYECYLGNLKTSSKPKPTESSHVRISRTVINGALAQTCFSSYVLLPTMLMLLRYDNYICAM